MAEGEELLGDLDDIPFAPETDALMPQLFFCGMLNLWAALSPPIPANDRPALLDNDPFAIMTLYRPGYRPENNTRVLL